VGVTTIVGFPCKVMNVVNDGFYYNVNRDAKLCLPGYSFHKLVGVHCVFYS